MKHICGIEMQESGDIAAVWVAFSPEIDLTQVYDCFKFQKGEVLPVIASALKARGRNIPVAWRNEEFALALRKEGCLMLPDPVDKSPEMADIVSREIFERMRSGRFKVERRLSEWREEEKTFTRDGNKIPTDAYPLMAATRHAVSSLRWARGDTKGLKKAVFPKLAVH